MNLKATVEELRKTRGLHILYVGQIDNLLTHIEGFQATSEPTIPLPGKKAFVSVPPLKARAVKPMVEEKQSRQYHHRVKKVCLNCGKKYLTKRPMASKFHSDRCRNEWNNMQRKKGHSHRTLGRVKNALDPNSRTAKITEAIKAGANITRRGVERTHATPYSLFCQNPACGKPFNSSKPWARWCPDCFRIHHRLTKLYPVPKNMAYRMTANEPPKPLNATNEKVKPVKLVVGDPLRAGGPDVTGH